MSRGIHRHIDSLPARRTSLNAKRRESHATADRFEVVVARSFGELLSFFEFDPIEMLDAVRDARGERGNFYDSNRRVILEGLFNCDLKEMVANGHRLSLLDGRVYLIGPDLRTWQLAGSNCDWDKGRSIESLLCMQQTRRDGPTSGVEFDLLLGPALKVAVEKIRSHR
jgi:hypothetical protein